MFRKVVAEQEKKIIKKKKKKIYLIIEDLIPSQPHRVISGIFTKSNLTEVEYDAKHVHFTNVKHINIIRKSVP